MAFKIKLATTTELLDKAFKLRHQVFFEEERMLQKAMPDGRFIDRFDTYPTTHTLVALSGAEVVGSFRLVLDSSEGLPADDYYDFRKHIPENSYIMHTSLLCISQTHRNPKLATGLFLMGIYFAISHDVTHVVAPINPKLKNWLIRIGYRAVDDEFTEPHIGTQMLPMLLDIRNLNDVFLKFIQKNQLQDFLLDYERWFYKSGEMMIRAGEIGQEAFLITEGTAQVRVAGTEQKIGELSEGDLFGELALITDEPRSADVIAMTDVQVMVLSKSAFHTRFLKQPEQALQLVKLLGKRTLSLIQQLEQFRSA